MVTGCFALLVMLHIQIHFACLQFLNYLELVFQVDFVDTNRKERSENEKLTVAPALVYSPEPFLQIKIEYDFVLNYDI